MGRGFLKNPEKTAEVFINDLIWSFKFDGKHRRLYKTGDMAHYNANGCIIFCGRKDAQVKVRGQRMELGKFSIASPVKCPLLYKLTSKKERSNLISANSPTSNTPPSYTLPLARAKVSWLAWFPLKRLVLKPTEMVLSSWSTATKPLLRQQLRRKPPSTCHLSCQVI